MSETTTFLGGAAIAGLAALLFMRSGVGSSQPFGTAPLPPPPVSSSTPVPLPTPTLPPSPAPTSVVPASNPYYEQQSQAQKQMIAQLQTAVEQQRAETDKLRGYIQRQQLELEVLKTQAKTTAVSPQTTSPAVQPNANREVPANPLLLGILWALGGVTLSFGGGLILIMMFAWFVRQQQRNARMNDVYNNRNFQYLPPANGYYVQPMSVPRTPRRTRRIEDDY